MIKQSDKIADFGCGDAKIARHFDKNRDKNLNDNSNNYSIKVVSFDLIALNKYVTECDISNVPLEDESMDMVVFCLSLMGTNFHEYLIEAHRVLKPNGMLKIAEVRSRFYGINKFEKFLSRCGFDVVAKIWITRILHYFIVINQQSCNVKHFQRILMQRLY